MVRDRRVSVRVTGGSVRDGPSGILPSGPAAEPLPRLAAGTRTLVRVMGGGGPVGVDTTDAGEAPPSTGPLESGDQPLGTSRRSRYRHPLVWILAGAFALRF